MQNNNEQLHNVGEEIEAMEVVPPQIDPVQKQAMMANLQFTIQELTQRLTAYKNRHSLGVQVPVLQAPQE